MLNFKIKQKKNFLHVKTKTYACSESFFYQVSLCVDLLACTARGKWPVRRDPPLWSSANNRSAIACDNCISIGLNADDCFEVQRN